MDNNKSIKKKNKLSAPIELSEDVKQIYLTGVLGTFTNHDFRMILLNEKSKEGNNPGEVNLVRIGEYELIMSHSVAKKVYKWLGRAIDQFEEQVGEIEVIGPPKKKK